MGSGSQLHIVDTWPSWFMALALKSRDPFGSTGSNPVVSGTDGCILNIGRNSPKHVTQLISCIRLYMLFFPVQGWHRLSASHYFFLYIGGDYCENIIAICRIDSRRKSL